MRQEVEAADLQATSAPPAGHQGFRGQRPAASPLAEAGEPAEQLTTTTTAVRGQGLRGQRPVARPLAVESETEQPVASVVQTKNLRGQRPVLQQEVEEEDEPHQPMFKSFPIASEPRPGSTPARNNVEVAPEVPRYRTTIQNYHFTFSYRNRALEKTDYSRMDKSRSAQGPTILQ